jgi:hypothetical protein
MNWIIIKAKIGRHNPNKAHPNLLRFRLSAFLTQYTETTILITEPMNSKISENPIFSILRLLKI